jgi:vacuolar-type H+-ATPase subunit F/Vma7
MKTLFVGGTWDDGVGKPSKIVQTMSTVLVDKNTTFLNGGCFSVLEEMLENVEEFEKYGLIIWFADVPNNKQKIIRQIKAVHPKCLLVTSKRNLDNQYPLQELIARALQVKSNLFVEITKKR